MTPDEFASKIKTKYPQYSDIDNNELARKIISKHPEYSSQVDFGQVPQSEVGTGITPGPILASPISMPNDPNFDVNSMSRTSTGGIPYYQPPTPRTEAPIQPYKALLTNEPVEGYFNNAVRSIPAQIGGAAGALAGGGVGSVPGAALGYAGGEGIRQSAVGLNNMLRGGDVNGGEAARSMAAQGLIGGVSQKIANVIPEIPGAIGRGYDYMAKNFGGMRQGTIDTIKEDAGAVAGQLGSTRQDVGATGENMRSAIGDAVESGKEFYKQVAEKYSKPSAAGDIPVRLNIKGNLATKIKEIGQEAGYVSGDLKRISDKTAAEKFSQFLDLANEYDSASPRQLYFLQKDIAGAIRENEGKPLAAALGKVKSAINNFIQENADKLPADLLEANKAYAAASNIESDASKLTNANDAITYIKNAFDTNKYESQAKEGLISLSQRVPALGELIKTARSGVAAEEAGKLVRDFPDTGFKAGAIAAGAAAIKFPALIPLAPAFSPRAYLAGYQASQSAPAQAVSQAVKSVYRVLPSGTGRTALSTLAENYLSQNR